MRKEISDWLFRLVMGVIPVAGAVMLTGFATPPSTLEQVVRSGELRVATTVGPTTYYEDGHGAAGFEYDLARMFADHLGVRLKVVTPDSPDELFNLVARHEVHFAAAGIAVKPGNVHKVRLGPAYNEASQQLVYRQGTPPPASISEMDATVISGTRNAAIIERALAPYPQVRWQPLAGLEAGDLLARLWQSEVPYIIADSNEVSVSRRYYPELRVAFDITPPQPLSWAFPKGRDDSLVKAAEQFFGRINENGQLQQLRERYYGHVREFDYVGVRRFMRHVEQRLPKYETIFRRAAGEQAHDWRLLAAIGYQESHWNPEAVSPTGVRGIMMLTVRTASEVGIADRLDPSDSIRGGAAYLRGILERLPAHIEEPDRTWLALAAYNMGYGHLQDARMLTRRRGGNPDRWMDVKENLPLLMQSQWYKDTRYGYARGLEAVQYVQNIRGYYDMLVWQTKPQHGEEPTTVAAASEALPAAI